MRREAVTMYSEPLSRFIKIRLLTEDGAKRLRGKLPALRKKEYIDYIVKSCVLGTEQGIEDFLGHDVPAHNQLDIDDVKEHFYKLCVDVNPALDAHTEPATKKRRAASGGDRMKRLRMFEQEFEKRVMGQNHIVKPLRDVLAKDALDIRDRRKPVGSFLLAGPTGVGKTETAKAVAELYFDGFVMVDCAAYGLPHEYAKLIGAPPGYVGHERKGFLTEQVKKTKRSVVLFDEFEKAHGTMHNIVLQLLDEGHMSDNQGEMIDFTGTLVLMTVNEGSHDMEAYRNRIAGFSPAENCQQAAEGIYTEALRKYFRPELMNRFDGVLVYNPLTEESATGIAGKSLDAVTRRLSQAGVGLRYSRRTAEALAELAEYRRYGGRGMERAVEEHITSPLTDMMLAGEIGPGDCVAVGYRNDSFVFRRVWTGF